MKKIGLYFGTFNPIHVGHLVIANYMAAYTDLDEIWLVVSPQNPLKDQSELLEDHKRLAMVQEAVKDNENIKVSNIEFNLPQPSYTIHTLKHLAELYKDLEFSIIMGEDNLRTFRKWKGYEYLIEHYRLYVYPRVLTEQEQDELDAIGNEKGELYNHKHVVMCDAPVMKVSATFIRNAIKEKKDVRYLLTEPVHRFVREHKLYEN